MASKSDPKSAPENASQSAPQNAPQCIALTKQGDRCRNRAKDGSRYCGVHAALDARAQKRKQVVEVAGQLNALADEVHSEDPAYVPPPFSPDALLAILQQNAAVVASHVPSQTLKDIVDNLEGTKAKDLVDPETWKGLWYILNYSIQGQAKGAMDQVSRTISMIPGMELVMQFGQSVKETPGELLNIETWKGALIVLNAAVSANVDAIKDKISSNKVE